MSGVSIRAVRSVQGPGRACSESVRSASTAQAFALDLQGPPLVER
ncbi:hypothetical protein [Paraburkholderia hospita]